MNRRRVLPLLALAALLFTGAAVADTGGSMGGGSWGGGGGGGGGGYSGGGGGYSGGGGGYSGGGYSHSSGGGWSSSSSGGPRIDCGDLGPGGLLFILGALVVGSIAVAFIKSATDRDYPDYSNLSFSSAPMVVSGVDVSELRVVIDGRARRFVQTELSRIAKVADTKTDEGRAAMLREVAMMLRKLRDAWVYGGAVNHPMRDLTGAKREFDRAVDEARSKFREEVIRNADGTIQTRVASDYAPRGDEGAGVILVSLILAARRELFTVTRIGNGEALRNALEGASQLTPGNLVAIEIVWQPAEDSDRLSSMELEAKYPRPELIPITNALVGKTFCTYCAGPFPGELVSCPHCGAPAPGRPANQAA